MDMLVYRQLSWGGTSLHHTDQQVFKTKPCIAGGEEIN